MADSMPEILSEYATMNKAFVERHRGYLVKIIPGTLKSYDEGFISLSAMMVIAKDSDPNRSERIRVLEKLGFSTPIG